jgi:hypothetical protein
MSIKLFLNSILFSSVEPSLTTIIEKLIFELEVMGIS